jgi:hypothetical protein
MIMLRVKCVRRILPNICVGKSFALQLLDQLSLVHTPDSTSRLAPAHILSPKHGRAPSALMGADAERAYRLQERSSLFLLALAQAGNRQRSFCL